ncbi:putative oxidoreductase CzcO [Streptomyces sp. NP10]|nr:putative oxidoreductase CzcO [Streptomyces sp. NP10]
MVVDGGQAGLATGYHLPRRDLDFVILDAEATPGRSSRQHMRDSLHLFPPAADSSLPGRPMPGQPGGTYPEAGHVVHHPTDCEKRYELTVLHGARAGAVRRGSARLRVEADAGTWRARAVISATGTWTRPFPPAVPTLHCGFVIDPLTAGASGRRQSPRRAGRGVVRLRRP